MKPKIQRQQQLRKTLQQTKVPRIPPQWQQRLQFRNHLPGFKIVAEEFAAILESIDEEAFAVSAEDRRKRLHGTGRQLDWIPGAPVKAGMLS